MSLLSPQLEAFIAVVNYGTVHGAAKEICLTQTAVTQRIHTLEARLKTTLFTRTRRGMKLTSEGEALLRYCNAAKDLEGEALAKIKGAAVDSEIQICITGPTSIMHSRIIPKCCAILPEFPNLLMYFDVNDKENRHLALRTDQCQFAILQVEDVEPEMESKILKPEKYVLVCSATWKKRPLKDIITNERIIDYDPSDKMTFNYLKHFNLFVNARHDRHFANRTELMAMMIKQGLGYGVLAKEFATPYIEQQELAILNNGRIYENEIVLAWYKRPEPPKYFTALINAIS